MSRSKEKRSKPKEKQGQRPQDGNEFELNELGMSQKARQCGMHSHRAMRQMNSEKEKKQTTWHFLVPGKAHAFYS